MLTHDDRDVTSVRDWKWPRIRVRVALALLGAFLCIGLSQGSAVFFGLFLSHSEYPWAQPFVWEVTGALSAYLALPIVQTAAVNAPAPNHARLRFGVTHLIAFFAFALSQMVLMLGSRICIYAAVGWGRYDYGPLLLRLGTEIPQNFVNYAAIATVWSLVLAWQSRHERALHAAQLESELRSAQLQTLTGQLNPHFLFNALHTVSAVMYEDLARTDRLISDLGQLLRASLQNGGPTWELSEEVIYARRFVDILEARFGGRLVVRWAIAEGVSAMQVPRFALQSLVDNAVKHNHHVTESLEVRVRAFVVGVRWRLEVEDTGRGFSEQRSSEHPGLGLAHLRKALLLLHGPAAHLVVGRSSEGGALVTLEFPGERS